MKSINGLIENERELGNHLLCEMEAEDLKRDDSIVWRSASGYIVVAADEDAPSDADECLGTLGSLFKDVDEA